MRALYAAAGGTDLEAGGEDNFTYGLERTLDGIEARLQAIRQADRNAG
jgi:hypothetical protein